jgi:hypothetical protein
MRRVLFAFASLVWMSLASGASAGSLELTYQAVVHLAVEHHVDVTAAEKRRLGIAGFRGLAIFGSGELANYRYQGTYTFRDGSGSFRGVAVWHFDDGSQIHATYEGEAMASGKGITFSGSQQVISGNGRFAGASGSGKYQGRRVDNLKDGGDTYWSGTLSLKIP